jgi:hypothetical protein
MTDFEEHLWSYLAAEHDADRLLAAELGSKRRSKRPLVLGGAAIAATGIAAAAVSLTLSATTSTQKAYALTEGANGSYTLTLQDVANGLPQVNSEFAKLGIPARAIPVTADCTAKPDGLSLLSPGDVSMGFSVTFSAKAVPAGWTDFIAVEQTPSGVRESIGSSSQPLPACLNSYQAPPRTVDPVTTTTAGRLPRAARRCCSGSTAHRAGRRAASQPATAPPDA